MRSDSRDRHFGAGYAVAMGMLLVVAAFPFVFALLISFQRSSLSGFAWSFDLDAWRSVFATGRFDVVPRSLRIALVVAAVSTAISVPAAFALLRLRPGIQATALALMTAPFFVDLTSRIFALRIALSRDGLVEGLFARLGIPVEWVSGLLFSETGVLLGMFSAYSCTAFFPVFVIMSRMPDNVLDAGRSLGCSEARLMARVVVPLSMQGIACGFLLCLLCVLSDLVVPGIIGGSMVSMLGPSIQSAVTAFRYPVVGGLTIILFLSVAGICALTLLLLRVRRRSIAA